MLNQKKGVIYTATGKGYVQMAIQSAKSLKVFHPNLAVHLFTDQENIATTFIDSVELIEAPDRRSKIGCMARSPFHQTLFLDADTKVLAPIDGLFCLLKKYDLAMAHASIRNQFATNQVTKIKVPEAFCQLNSGVVLYKKSPDIINFFLNWEKEYQQSNFRLDQVTLRTLVWKSKLKLGVLPPQYNVRDQRHNLFWNERRNPSKILHFDTFKHQFNIPVERKKNKSRISRAKYFLNFVQWIVANPHSWKPYDESTQV